MEEPNELQAELQKVLTHYLSRGKKIDPAIALINRGAIIDPKSDLSWGLFTAAVQSKQTELAKLLVEKGLKVTDVDPEFGNTTLHFAALTGDEATVKYLLEINANPQARNKKKRTPRDLAAERNQGHIVNLLPKNQTLTFGSPLHTKKELKPTTFLTEKLNRIRKTQ